MRGTANLILLTGASGMVGLRLARALLERGHAVRALVLPRDPGASQLSEAGCELCEADLSRRETLPPALEGVDTVYHLAAVILTENARAFRRVNQQGTAALLEAAVSAGSVRHFIYVSSASIVYPRPTPYSRSKRGAEEEVRAVSGKLGITIVRPTLVYGSVSAELDIFRAYLRRAPIVLLPGGGTARKMPVHVDDLVQGLAAIAGNARSIGRTYDLCGPEAVSLSELSRLLLEQEGLRRRILPVPIWLCRLTAALAGRLAGRSQLAAHALAGLTQDALLDPRPAMADLDYAPRGVRDGLLAQRDTRLGNKPLPESAVAR